MRIWRIAKLSTLISVILPTTIWGQSAPSPEEQSQDTLTEVVVTAQRREESLQAVPISITTATAGMVNAAGLTVSTDIPLIASAVTIASQVNNPQIMIRGVGDSGTLNTDAANPIYLDGVYRGAQNADYFALNNIDRIEVDKGPQGTLFGRNAVGGAIQVITKDPQQTPQFDGSVGYGNYNTNEEQLYVTGGISNGLAADLAIYNKNQNDGWGNNVFNGTQAYKGEAFAARSKWLWNVDDLTTVKIAFMYSSTSPPQINGGQLLPTQVTFAGLPPRGGFYDSDTNWPDSFYAVARSIDATIRHNLGWADLVSISSFTYLNETLYSDQDESPVNLINDYFTSPAHNGSQELQLISRAGSSIDWAAGLYYYGSSIGLKPLMVSGPGVAPVDYVAYNSTSKDNSYAVYGQATLPIGDKTKLTLGARESVDQPSIDVTFYTNFGVVPSESGRKSATQSEPTWNITLNHQFTDDMSAYASVRRGYHGGLFNWADFTNPEVKPEVLDSYSVGEKWTLFGDRLRLNTEVFYYNYKDVQVQEVLTGSTFLVNAAKSEMKGVDVDLAATPVTNLTLQASISYLDATYTSFPNAPFFEPSPTGGDIASVGNASGNDAILSPRWVFSLFAQYKLGDFSLAANNYYNAGYYFDPQNAYKQSAYDLVNTSLNWTPSNKWSVKLWANNVLNRQYYSFISPQALGTFYFPGDPRTFGLSVRMRVH